MARGSTKESIHAFMHMHMHMFTKGKRRVWCEFGCYEMEKDIAEM